MRTRQSLVGDFMHTHTHKTKLATFPVGISIYDIFLVKVPKESVKVLTESKISCSFMDA